MTNLAKIAALVTALLGATAPLCRAANSSPPGTLVEFESPLASHQPLQGYLRLPDARGPAPAVVLLHGCNGSFRRLDERWGKRIVAWGYATLTVDSFGPRGLTNTCGGGAPVATAFDAYRALDFLVQQPSIDPARVAVIGFSQGGWLALTSIERGAIERSSKAKFRAAVAFYPPCLGFKDRMTVPTLILIGELDDWTLAGECRNLADGRDDYGISRQNGEGVPIQLIVYPGAYHAFDVPSLATPRKYFGHHLEFSGSATDQAIDAVQKFLYATIGGKEN